MASFEGMTVTVLHAEDNAKGSDNKATPPMLFCTRA
nr:hypothetical protein [Erwinia rhapontici]